jgi:hypothetical protein
MEFKHTQRQINNAILDSQRVTNVNRVMKKVNQASDFLYESMIDKERAYTVSACAKLKVLCEEIENNMEKYLKDAE